MSTSRLSLGRIEKSITLLIWYVFFYIYNLFMNICLVSVGKIANTLIKIGFLTEWQLYAQKIEGDAWIGDKLDEQKLAKMSGEFIYT